MNVHYIAGILLGLVFAVVPVAGAIVIATKVTGKARTLGILGCAVLAFQAFASQVYSVMLPSILSRFDLSIQPFATAMGLVLSLVHAAGLILLIAAVCAGRRAQVASQFPAYGQPADRR